MKLIFYLITTLVLFACDTKTSTYYCNLASDQEAKGNFKEAIKLLDKALEKNPTNILALSNRGFDYLELKQYDNAKKNFGKMIQLDKNCPGAYYALGCLNYDLHNYKAALGCFEKTIKIKGGGQYVPNSYVDPPFSLDVSIELVYQLIRASEEKIKLQSK